MLLILVSSMINWVKEVSKAQMYSKQDLADYAGWKKARTGLHIIKRSSELSINLFIN